MSATSRVEGGVEGAVDGGKAAAAELAQQLILAEGLCVCHDGSFFAACVLALALIVGVIVSVGCDRTVFASLWCDDLDLHLDASGVISSRNPSHSSVAGVAHPRVPRMTCKSQLQTGTLNPGSQ